MAQSNHSGEGVVKASNGFPRRASAGRGRDALPPTLLLRDRRCGGCGGGDDAGLGRGVRGGPDHRPRDGYDPRLALDAGPASAPRWWRSRSSPRWPGYALQSWLPEALLQLIVGTLLLIFGLQWLRKAILRAAGLKALHDEEDAFRSEVEAARARRRGAPPGARLVRLRGQLQGRLPRGPRDRLHRHHLRAERRLDRARHARRRDRRGRSCSPPASRCTSRWRGCPRTRSSSSSACCSAPSAPSGPSRAWAGSPPTTRA